MPTQTFRSSFILSISCSNSPPPLPSPLVDLFHYSVSAHLFAVMYFRLCSFFPKRVKGLTCFCLSVVFSHPLLLRHPSNMASQWHINGPISAAVGICCSDTNWELTGIDVLCLASELSWPYEEFMTWQTHAHTHTTWMMKKWRGCKLAFVFSVVRFGSKLFGFFLCSCSRSNCVLTVHMLDTVHLTWRQIWQKWAWAQGWEWSFAAVLQTNIWGSAGLRALWCSPQLPAESNRKSMFYNGLLLLNDILDGSWSSLCMSGFALFPFLVLSVKGRRHWLSLLSTKLNMYLTVWDPIVVPVHCLMGWFYLQSSVFFPTKKWELLLHHWLSTFCINTYTCKSTTGTHVGLCSRAALCSAACHSGNFKITAIWSLKCLKTMHYEPWRRRDTE